MTNKKSILLRLSPEEYDRISQLANKSVFSREEFIRQILQEATIVERPPAEYGEILRELRGISNNIQHILLKLQTLGFADEPMMIDALNRIRSMDRVFTNSFIPSERRRRIRR
jgi:hypothetical protein